jgi:hypothetical protein
MEMMEKAEEFLGGKHNGCKGKSRTAGAYKE